MWYRTSPRSKKSSSAPTAFSTVMSTTWRAWNTIRNTTWSSIQQMSTKYVRFGTFSGLRRTMSSSTFAGTITNGSNSSSKRTRVSSTHYAPNHLKRSCDDKRRMDKTWILVVDTETTGFPPRSVPIENSTTWAQCRIVQMAWRLYDGNGVLKEEKCYIIQPDKDTIFSEGAVRVHGISKERATREGTSMEEVMNDLHVSLANVKTIVAHNIAFDDPVIQAEMFRWNRLSLLALWKTKERYCTMLAGTRPGERWPKLAVLYERLYGTPAQGQLHSADTDTTLCADIYFRQIGKR